MKTFVCAVSTFAVLFAIVILNSAFISNITDGILQNIDKASDAFSTKEDRIDAIDAIRQALGDNSFPLSLSVGRDDMSSLLAFVSDAEHQINGDDGQFMSALEKLKVDIMRLRTSECFCLDGLF